MIEKLRLGNMYLVETKKASRVGFLKRMGVNFMGTQKIWLAEREPTDDVLAGIRFNDIVSIRELKPVKID